MKHPLGMVLSADLQLEIGRRRFAGTLGHWESRMVIRPLRFSLRPEPAIAASKDASSEPHLDLRERSEAVLARTITFCIGLSCVGLDSARADQRQPDIPEGQIVIEGDIIVPENFFEIRGT